MAVIAELELEGIAWLEALVWQGWVLVGVGVLIVWLLVGLVVAVGFGRAIRGRPKP